MVRGRNASYERSEKGSVDMKLLNGSILVLFLAFGFGLGTSLSLPAAGLGFYQEGYPAPGPYPAPYTDLRGLVDRTQSDLRAAADLEQGKEKDHERFRNAQGHLSTFDRHLVKGRFDKGELNKSLDSIKDILDHNVLQASSRDALMRDEQDLRVARDRSW